MPVAIDDVHRRLQPEETRRRALATKEESRTTPGPMIARKDAQRRIQNCLYAIAALEGHGCRFFQNKENEIEDGLPHSFKPSITDCSIQLRCQEQSFEASIFSSSAAPGKRQAATLVQTQGMRQSTRLFDQAQQNAARQKFHHR